MVVCYCSFMQSLNSRSAQSGQPGYVSHHARGQRLYGWAGLQRHPCWSHVATLAAAAQAVVAVTAAVNPEAASAAADAGQLPASDAAEQQQQRKHAQQRRGNHRQKQEVRSQDMLGSYAGRLYIKQRLPGPSDLPSSLSELRDSLPRGITAGQFTQQQQQQQRQRAPQSLLDKNMSFSGALKRLQGLEEMLLLLRNSQWGPGLCDLDGMSVAGALMWLVRSSEWQAVKQGAAGSDGSWQLRQQGQQSIELLLDRAADLILPLQQPQQQQSLTSAPALQQQQQPAAGAPAAVPLMRPAELAAVIYCCSKLGQHRPQLQASAAAALSQDLYACSTTELFRLIWGLASARVDPGDAWLLNFCKAAQAKFFMTNAMQLAIMVYGLARLGYRPPDIWIAAWLEASEPLLGGFSAQNLTNAAWGLSCWRFQAPEHWLTAFYAATAAAMPQLQPVGISQLQLALVTLGAGKPPPQEWIASMVAVAEPQLQQMELLQLCNFGWGLAQWQYCPPADTMAAYLAASQPLLAAATPTDLSTLLWICDKLSYVPQQQWLEGWFAAAAASLPRFEPQHLTTVALVHGRWGLLPVAKFSMEYWRCSKARFKDFSAYQMSLLVWGLGKVHRSVPKTWATSLLATFTQQLLQEAEAEDVCRLVCGLSSVVVKPKGCKDWVETDPAAEQQLQQLCSWLQPQLQQLEPRWLMLLVRGLERLGFRETNLPQGFFRGLQDAAAQFDELLAPQQRQHLQQEFGRMRSKAPSGS